MAGWFHLTLALAQAALSPCSSCEKLASKGIPSIFHRNSTGILSTGPTGKMSDDISALNDDAAPPAARAAGHQPALTGCPWHDVNEMLQAAGFRPTRQRMALGWLLF